MNASHQQLKLKCKKRNHDTEKKVSEWVLCRQSEYITDNDSSCCCCCVVHMIGGRAWEGGKKLSVRGWNMTEVNEVNFSIPLPVQILSPALDLTTWYTIFPCCFWYSISTGVRSKASTSGEFICLFFNSYIFQLPSLRLIECQLFFVPSLFGVFFFLVVNYMLRTVQERNALFSGIYIVARCNDSISGAPWWDELMKRLWLWRNASRHNSTVEFKVDERNSR